MIRSVIIATAGVVALVGIGWLHKGFAEEEELPESTKEKAKKGQGKNFRGNPPAFDPPEGFYWHEPRSFYVILCVPDSWHVREDEASSTIYATKNKSKGEDKSLTGFTVSCSQHKPKDYVPHFLRSYPGVLKRFGKENISEWETKELRGNLTKHTISFEDNSGPEVLVKCCIIVNEVTGTVYMVTFETRKIAWEKNWDIFGSVMTDNLLLLNSF